jgi:uncharacterized protein YceK
MTRIRPLTDDRPGPRAEHGYMSSRVFMPSSRGGVAVAGLAVILLTVSGCAAVDSLAYGRATAHYDNAAAYAQEKGHAPTWMPTDAVDIVEVASTRADDTATVAFDSASGPAGCDDVDRRSAPTMNVEGVDVFAIDRVALCGDWAVATDGEGAFTAWTPAIEAEGSE